MTTHLRSHIVRGTAWVLLCYAVMARPATATERESSASARCRELRAAARSSALLLRAPQLQVAAVRPPRVGDISGTGIFPGGELQLRTALAWPALDLFRGNSVLNTADAECERWIAREDAEEILGQSATFGLMAALEAEIAVMSAGLPRLEQLAAETQQRLDRGIITVLENDDLRLRKFRYESRITDLRHDLSLLQAQGTEADARGLSTALHRYESASDAVQQEQSFQRKLDAWHVDLQAGGIPYPQPDWYGMVAVSWNFGSIGQHGAEDEALAAGNAATRTGASELRPRAERFARAMQESATHLNDELSVLDKQLAFIDGRLTDVSTGSDRVRQAVALLEIERLELQGRRAYLEKLRTIRGDAGRSLQ